MTQTGNKLEAAEGLYITDAENTFFAKIMYLPTGTDTTGYVEVTEAEKEQIEAEKKQIEEDRLKAK